MKSLILVNCSGNFNSLELEIPDSMNVWNVRDFTFFFQCSVQEGEEFLVEIVDPLKFQHFSNLLCHPEALLSAPLTLKQDGRHLGVDDQIILDGRESCVELIAVEDFPVDPTKVDLAKINRRDYLRHQDFIEPVLTELYDFAKYPLARIDRFEELRQGFADQQYSDQVSCVYRFAQIIYQAPVENYSRLVAEHRFFSPLQMWRNILQGNGGLCAEKTSAFKFICDVLNIPSTAVFGSSTPIKGDIERQLVDFCAGATPKPSFWLQHHMLEIRIGGRAILVDASNGNLPLLFLNEADRDIRYCHGFRPCQVYHRQKLFLYPSTELAGDLMLTLAEYHSRNLTFEYVLTQRMGLLICEEFYIGVFCDWAPERSRVIQQHYATLAKKRQLPCPAFFHEENLDSLESEPLRRLIGDCLQALRNQYPRPEYSGDFSFVFQALTPPAMPRRRISRDLALVLEPMMGKVS